MLRGGSNYGIPFESHLEFRHAVIKMWMQILKRITKKRSSSFGSIFCVSFANISSMRSTLFSDTFFDFTPWWMWCDYKQVNATPYVIITVCPSTLYFPNIFFCVKTIDLLCVSHCTHGCHSALLLINELTASKETPKPAYLFNVHMHP